MVLSSSQLIEIDAAVIGGLAILLTFQILSPLSFDTDLEKAIDNVNEIELEIVSLTALYEAECIGEYNITKQSNCDQLDWDLSKTYADRNALVNDIAFYSEATTLTDPENSYHAIVYILNVISKLVLIPFVISAIIEIRKTSQQERKDNPASKLGLNTLIIGFILLVVILTSNATISSIGFF